MSDIKLFRINKNRSMGSVSIDSFAFDVNADVILPDHLHRSWTLPENDADFSLR